MSVEKGTEGALRARRRFLAKCGKFAVVTPPIVTLMLANQSPSQAVSGFSATSRSGGNRQGNNGFGNGGHDGVPGRSQHQDETR